MSIRKYLKNLNELNEDLESDYSTYYRDIPREDFDRVIALDPTYKANSNNKGEFAKWLLTLYKKGERFEDQTVNSQLTTALGDYKDVKSLLKGPNAQYKDILKFKSAEDLINFMHNLDLTQTTELETKCRNVEGANIVARNKDWVIYNPTTWEASKLIRGTNAIWCTGRHGSDSYDSSGKMYFDNYTNPNKRNTLLFIFINSNNENIKYQLAYSVARKNVYELRDSDNREVKLKTLFARYKTLADLIMSVEPFSSSPEFIDTFNTSTEVYNLINKWYDINNNALTFNDDFLNTISKLRENYDREKLSTLAAILSDSSIKELTINTSLDRFFTTLFKLLEDYGGYYLSSSSQYKFVTYYKYLFKITINSPISFIPASTFSGLEYLRYCTLPKTIKGIGANAFKDCADLRFLYLSKNITTIEESAFSGCDRLKLVTPYHSIKCQKSDLEWFKQHLKWEDREQEIVGKPSKTFVKTRTPVQHLEESFNPTMPVWLKDYLDNLSTRQWYVNDFGKDLMHSIDLQKAEFVDIDPSAADVSQLKNPLNLPIFLLGRRDYTTRNFIYIPKTQLETIAGMKVSYTYPDDIKKRDRYGSITSYMSPERASLKTLIDNAIHICYIPNFQQYLLANKIAKRRRDKQELPPNYERNSTAYTQQKVTTEVPAHYNNKGNWVNKTTYDKLMYVLKDGFDKSGYKLETSAALIAKALETNKITTDGTFFVKHLKRLSEIKDDFIKKYEKLNFSDLASTNNLEEVNTFIADFIRSIGSAYREITGYLTTIKNRLDLIKKYKEDIDAGIITDLSEYNYNKNKLIHDIDKYRVKAELSIQNLQDELDRNIEITLK